MVIGYGAFGGAWCGRYFYSFARGRGVAPPQKKMRGFRACGDEKTAMCWYA